MATKKNQVQEKIRERPSKGESSGLCNCMYIPRSVEESHLI